MNAITTAAYLCCHFCLKLQGRDGFTRGCWQVWRQVSGIAGCQEQGSGTQSSADCSQMCRERVELVWSHTVRQARGRTGIQGSEESCIYVGQNSQVEEQGANAWEPSTLSLLVRERLRSSSLPETSRLGTRIKIAFCSPNEGS